MFVFYPNAEIEFSSLILVIALHMLHGIYKIHLALRWHLLMAFLIILVSTRPTEIVISIYIYGKECNLFRASVIFSYSNIVLFLTIFSTFSFHSIIHYPCSSKDHCEGEMSSVFFVQSFIIPSSINSSKFLVLSFHNCIK